MFFSVFVSFLIGDSVSLDTRANNVENTKMDQNASVSRKKGSGGCFSEEKMRADCFSHVTHLSLVFIYPSQTSNKQSGYGSAGPHSLDPGLLWADLADHLES